MSVTNCTANVNKRLLFCIHNLENGQSGQTAAQFEVCELLSVCMSVCTGVLSHQKITSHFCKVLISLREETFHACKGGG